VAKFSDSIHHSVMIIENSIASSFSHLTNARLALLVALALSICFSPQDAVADNRECGLDRSENVITSPLLSVLSLNMAHGRGDALNQILQKTSTTRKNLQAIADFLDNSGADLVALQEADAPSRWSGNFDHVEFVSQNSLYPCQIHTSHAKKYMYDFGTALLSRVPYSKRLHHTFEPSPPTTNKGFVMGEVRWNPGGLLPEPIAVSVISVHLDFSRKKVREGQIEEMRIVLKDMARPAIILGDFNTDWSTDESVLKTIAANKNLKVFEPHSTELGTYKNGKHRLDWILISRELEFITYEVPDVVLSDHQPVLATLGLVDISDKDADSNQNEMEPETSHD